MPKRTDIEKIMIIGSGPIIIGQACEFDYSGSQACKALRSLGYKIVLVNSNPATIMTDPDMADATYIEPLNVKSLTAIIEKERPCAILPSLGGQSALNLCMELHSKGILDKYGVKVIGVQTEAIRKGEDRIAFKETMEKLNIDMPKSKPAYSVEEAVAIARELGYPAVIRPAYTLGGTGGGLVRDEEELRTVVSRGLSASLIGQVLVEESVLGWDELELEVIRDSKDQIITVCFIENVDPIGVHTGDSICVSPMLTISQELQKRLEKYAHDIVRAIGVVGGTNVQFAHNPKNGRVVVIEINPRTSRSSALASKAVGLPIALVSAMLAAGITLDEIPYWKKGSLEKYTPQADYVVVKYPRWAFEKYPGAQDRLGTQMKAVGEVMSIGKNYKEALQKAVRSLEIGRSGLGFAKNFHSKSLEELLELLKEPSSERMFIMYEALRKGATVKKLQQLTCIKEWFIQQMKELVDMEEEILKYRGRKLPLTLLEQAKRDGFSDQYLSKLLDMPEREIRLYREAAGIRPGWGSIPVSGVENAEYFYSSYNLKPQEKKENKGNKKVMILGSGPNRIGQGIEFDYCCVHAAYALKDLGYESIMVNCNPETVSTDYDTSDKLYFEPLTVEDVLNIYRQENPVGVIVQFGGQTPLNIAEKLAGEGVRILGTSLESINFAEDRDMFRHAMEKLNIPMPESGIASNLDEALKIANRIGYPLMVRPSFVLGGRGMEVVYDEETLRSYINAAAEITPDRPVLIDRFLEHAIESEADALSDGHNVYIPAVMEHIELAGIHSGDSACVIPTVSISRENIETIYEYTRKIAMELKVVGLMNIQYAIADGKVYVLEANPRASRTVPLVSKVCHISMARIATEIMMAEAEGREYDFSQLPSGKIHHYGVKEAVFPFNMFPEVDPVLGPEMRSTGEVLGLARNFGLAFFKAEEAAMGMLPVSGKVLISVKDGDKAEAVEVARGFAAMGFEILATAGTARYLEQHGIEARLVLKVNEGQPDILDCINKGNADLIINTPLGKNSQADDSYIRKAAIRNKIPYITTMAAAKAAVKGIEAYKKSLEEKMELLSLQEYHK